MQPAKGYVRLFFALPVQAMLGPIPSLSQRTLMHPPMPWLQFDTSKTKASRHYSFPASLQQLENCIPHLCMAQPCPKEGTKSWNKHQPIPHS